MARARGGKEYLNFSRGLLTEISPLASADNTTADELNLLISRSDGTRLRRKGLEELWVTDAIDSDYRPIQCYFWERYNIVLVIHRKTSNEYLLYAFYTTTGTLIGTVPVQDADAVYTDRLSIAELKEYLICSSYSKPVAFTYNSVDGIKYSRVTLSIRDFRLLNDELKTSERPVSLTDSHKYNLLNAGWYYQRRLVSSGSIGDTITDFFTSESKYPSNADRSALGVKLNTTTGKEEFSSDTLKEVNVGSTEAPRGHYIFSLPTIDRNVVLSDPNYDGGTSDISLPTTPSIPPGGMIP